MTATVVIICIMHCISKYNEIIAVSRCIKTGPWVKLTNESTHMEDLLPHIIQHRRINIQTTCTLLVVIIMDPCWKIQLKLIAKFRNMLACFLTLFTGPWSARIKLSCSKAKSSTILNWIFQQGCDSHPGTFHKSIKINCIHGMLGDDGIPTLLLLLQTIHPSSVLLP